MNVIIAGDFVPQDRALDLINNEAYSTVLGSIKPFVENTDYSIVNLEAPIIEGSLCPITKNGPNLYAPIKTLHALKYAGFSCVTLANNHFYDQGEKGVLTTLDKCYQHQLDYVGAGKNLEDASCTLYKEIKGETIAIINCCEFEYSIATKDTAGCNPINPIKQFYAINEAKERADYVLVIVHGGIELCQYPTMRMQEWYRFFIDAGADAVLNHHQHCYSGYEVYNGKPIFYGLGNFCFDRPNQRESLWNYGYMVELSLNRNIGFRLIPYVQCSTSPSISPLEEKHEQLFFTKIKELNAVIGDNNALCEKSFSFMDSNEMGMRVSLTCYKGRIAKALYRRGFLPDSFPRKNWSELRDNILCESHLDRLRRYVIKQYDKRFPKY